MLQVFLARARNFLWDRSGDWGFEARSAERDAETDRACIASIMAAIDTALQDAEKEQSGLKRRVDEVLARVAVTLGNESDEYIARDPLDDHHQDLFSAEIANGERRMAELATIISHLNFLRTAALTRFSGFRPTRLQS